MAVQRSRSSHRAAVQAFNIKNSSVEGTWLQARLQCCSGGGREVRGSSSAIEGGWASFSIQPAPAGPSRSWSGRHGRRRRADLPRKVGAARGAGGQQARGRAPGGRHQRQGRQGRGPGPGIPLWVRAAAGDGFFRMCAAGPLTAPHPIARRDEVVGVPNILRYLGRASHTVHGLYGTDPLSACQVRRRAAAGGRRAGGNCTRSGAEWLSGASPGGSY